jgi:hypothetical protein
MLRCHAIAGLVSTMPHLAQRLLLGAAAQLAAL